MPVQLTNNLTVCDSHLVLAVSGDYASESLSELGDLVAEASETHSCDRVVLDLRQLQGLVPNMDRFAAGVYASQIWTRSLHVAIVMQPEQIKKFFENTAYNRGVQTLVVSTMEEARAWLGV